MHSQSLRHMYTHIPRLGETFIRLRLYFCHLVIPQMGEVFALI